MAEGTPASAKPAAGRKPAPVKAAAPKPAPAAKPVEAPAPVKTVAQAKIVEPAKAKPAPVKAAAPAPKPAPVAAKPVPAPAPKPVVAKAPVAAKVEAPKPVKAEAAKPVPAKPAPAKPAKVVATPPAWLDPTPVTDLPKIETVAAVTTEPTTSTEQPELPGKGARIMTDTIAQTKVTTDQFQAAFGDFSAKAKEAMEKSSHVAEEFADLTRGNIEALMASSKTAAKYVETLSQGAADYGRRSFEQASTTFKSFSEVKTPNDLLKLQSDYARLAFDQWVAESAKVSEAMIKMTNEVVEPLTSRYAVAAERVKTLAV